MALNKLNTANSNVLTKTNDTSFHSATYDETIYKIWIKWFTILLKEQPLLTVDSHALTACKTLLYTAKRQRGVWKLHLVQTTPTLPYPPPMDLSIL